MKTKTKRSICHIVAALAFIYALGIVGGMDTGVSISDGAWRMGAALAVMLVATWKGGMI